MLVIIIPIIGALRKDHAKFHAKNNVYCYTETHFNIEENAQALPVEFYKTVFRLNGLDFNGYFEDSKSENT